MKNKKYIHKALTDLLHIQRKSFNTFLNSGFIEEFEKYFFTKDPNSTAYSNVFCITPFFTSDSFVEGVCFSSNCFGPVVAPSVAKHEQRIMETNATGRSFTRSFTRSYTRSACNIPSVCNTTWETSCETTSFFQIRNKPSNTKGINIGYFEIYLYPQYYLLTKPTFSEEYCLLLGKDYSSKIYIPILLIDSKTKRISYQYLYMGSLPLMTKHGFFITNGISRVIVNQIIRSPNVYFYKQSLKKLFFNKKGNKGNTDSTTHRNKSILGISGTSYYADIIPDRGTWLRLLFDKNGLLWACTKKLPKIPLLTFLLMFGLSLKQISSSIDIKYLFNGLSLRSNGVAQQLPKIALDPVCWDAFHRFIFTNTMNSLCEAKTSSNIVSKKLIFNTFVNAKYNGLGLNGRFALDTKLYLSFASVPFGPLSVCSIRTPSRLLVAFENKQRSGKSTSLLLFANLLFLLFLLFLLCNLLCFANNLLRLLRTTIVIFIPFVNILAVYITSGNINCSFNPKL
jgi:DNA-directed RNA polymerase beta subunit